MKETSSSCAQRLAHLPGGDDPIPRWQGFLAAPSPRRQRSAAGSSAARVGLLSFLVNAHFHRLNYDSLILKHESRTSKFDSPALNQRSRRLNNESRTLNRGSRTLNCDSPALKDDSPTLNQHSRRFNCESRALKRGSGM